MGHIGAREVFRGRGEGRSQQLRQMGGWKLVDSGHNGADLQVIVRPHSQAEEHVWLWQYLG